MTHFKAIHVANAPNNPTKDLVSQQPIAIFYGYTVLIPHQSAKAADYKQSATKERLGFRRCSVRKWMP